MGDEDRDYKLMIEIFKCHLKAEHLLPHHLVGKFVYTYHLDRGDSLGTPITADQLNEHIGKFLKAEGFEEYDRSMFCRFLHRHQVTTKKIGLNGKSTKFYLVNPLHKLNEDEHDD